MSYRVGLYSYKNDSRLNHYNFLFTTLHTTSFLFDKIDSGVLHLLCPSVTTSDTLKVQTRHIFLQENAIQFVRREIRYLLI